MTLRSRTVTALVALAVPLSLLPSLAHSAAPLPPKISAAGSGATLKLGDTFKVRVTVKRGAARQKVALQQRVGSKWKSVASKRLSRKGAVKRVTFASVPQRAGLYRYRAKLLPLRSTKSATSGLVRVRVLGEVTPPPPYVPRPLRLDVKNAAGLALPQAVAARRGVGTTTARAGSADLLAVAPTGATYPAITSGTADVRRFLIAPNGKVYVLFTRPVDLADTSVLNPPAGCLLAEVDPATGMPTCIDSTLQYVSWSQRGNPAIQFDARGAIYYMGSVSGRMILRRYQDGYTTDLINDNVMLHDFLARPDGNVFVSGQTSSSGATWTRRISPSGQLQTLAPGASHGGITAFPDGNVYLARDWQVHRFLTATGAMDPVPWLTSARDTSEQHQACPEPSPCQVQLNRSTQTSDGRVFAPDSPSAARPIQVFPTVSTMESSASTVHLLQGVGEHLLLAGTNAVGAHVLAVQHPASGEKVLFGSGNEVEVYHLSPVDSDTVWFDGLRFADNRVVVGHIELGTGAVTIGATVEGKWEDFQVFAR